MKKKILVAALSSKAACNAVFSYIVQPISLGSVHLVVINPLKVAKGSYLLLKHYLWDVRVLKNWILKHSGAPYSIGFRPAHVLVWLLVTGYGNWNWNLFGEMDHGGQRGIVSDEVYYRRFQKERIRQPGQPKHIIKDKWKPGSLGVPPKWEYFKSIRSFIWFLSTWY